MLHIIYRIKESDTMIKVFIDGSAGTTGLKIYERISSRNNIELIRLAEDERKDPKARKAAIFDSDITFLCLPDEAAKEAAEFAAGSNTVIIDTSTAHRTDDMWAYGFPELSGMREKIFSSKRIANPGCHASGFISLAAPLTENGIITKDAVLSCFSITGYSGGGKKMIAEYESENRNILLDAPRMYGLTQAHKHLPEMSKICGLENPPLFCPVVAPFYSGMEVTITLAAKDIKGTADDIKDIYRSYYTGGLVKYAEDISENGFASASLMSGRDDMIISVYGNNDRILLVSRFDNLGKGASGAAIQNMNIVLGVNETEGLVTAESEEQI